MATQQQIVDFIAKIAPCARHAYQEVGKVLPSVCIGMACVESGYGTAGSCRHNSFFGLKVGSGKTATKYWDGAFFKAKTMEEYRVGEHTVITDAFRAYTSMQQAVLNFYELLNTSRYAPVKAGHTYQMQMTEIKQCGYMTSSTEVASVIKIIQTHDLTQYDRPTDTSNAAGDEPRNGNPYPEPAGNVRMGSKGNAVRWLQVELNYRGYRLVVDGVAGEKTIDALKNYQYNHGLLCDGICGPATRKSLKAH